jgi:hypothetical protein
MLFCQKSLSDRTSNCSKQTNEMKNFIDANFVDANVVDANFVDVYSPVHVVVFSQLLLVRSK